MSPTSQAMSSPDTTSSRTGVRQVVAACALGVAGYGFYQALPVMLGLIAQHRGFSDQQVGWLGSAELAGMLLGGLFAACALAGVRHRALAGAGLALILGAMYMTWSVSGFGPTGVARLAGGFGAGTVYSICVASLAVTTSPTRNFGYLNAAMVVAASVQLSAVPWIDSLLGMQAVFAVLALQCVAAAVLLPALPVPAAAVRVRTGVPGLRSMGAGVRGWTFLVATSLFHVAPAAFWTYSERVGSELGLSSRYVGATLTVSSLLAAAACLFAWRIGKRWGQHHALLGTAVLLAVTLLSWAAPSFGTPGYILRAIFFFMAWGIAGVFQLSAVNELDASGRLAALIPVAQNAGLVCGPVAGAAILGWGFSLPGMLALNALFVVASLALYACVHIGAHREVATQAAA